MISKFVRISGFFASLALVLPFSPAHALEKPKEAAEKLAKETWLALDHFQNYHFSRKEIKELDTAEILTSYMKELDFNKMFFTEQDREEIIARFGPTLNEIYLPKGNLYPAFEIFSIYQLAANNRLEWVKERLKGDFDFTTEASFRPDRSELDWPADKAAADNLWNRRLKYELLQELLRDEELEDAKARVLRRYDTLEKSIREIDTLNVQEVFITAIAHMYDPHSTFLSSDSLEEFSIAMSNSLVGIGALLRDEEGYCVIQELIAGGPAEMSGLLHPGDKIIAVAQEEEAEPTDVIGMKLRSIVKMIRGEKGSKVYLTIVPAVATDPSERRTIVLTRDEIQLTENLAKARIYDVPNEHGEISRIGVINLPSFYGSSNAEEGGSAGTTKDVEELIKKLKVHNIDGLILDLRTNGGGLLSEAISLTGLFITKGPVVQVKDTKGRLRSDWDTNPDVAYEGPLVVLTSRRSASASEIVAGALQNLRRAIIVGDSSTHGKGTVQAIFELNRSFMSTLFPSEQKLGAAKITIQKFYLPNGNSTQNEGVTSDVIIPSINEFLPIGESDLPNALKWDYIDPVKWEAQKSFNADSTGFVDNTLLEYIRERSSHRMDQLEEFSYLKKNIRWFETKQNQKEISLNLEQRKAQLDQDQNFRDDMDSIRKELEQTNFKSTPVLLEVSEKLKEEHQQKLREQKLPNGNSKANQYYQKVFYYQEKDSTEIHEIWVENLNFDKAYDRREEFANFMRELVEKDIPDQLVNDFLFELKNGDKGSDFLFEKVVPETFADYIDEAESEALIPEILTKLVEFDPSVINSDAQLDIPLRESLRIMNDWLSLKKEGQGIDNSSMTAKAEG